MQIRSCGVAEQLGDRYKTWFTLFLMGAGFAVGAIIGNIGIGFGAAAGALAHWWATRRARLALHSAVVPYAKSWLRGRNYGFDRAIGAFVPNLPRALRYDSQNVAFVAECAGESVMYGPHCLLRSFRKALRT